MSEALGRNRRAKRRHLAAQLVDAITIRVGGVPILVPRWVLLAGWCRRYS